jgi:hypothetical protein
MKEIAADKGTPFNTRRRTIGTIPQSHVGKIRPRKHANRMLSTLFLGMMLRMLFSETKLLRVAETMTLISINGNASSTMLSKIILKLIKVFQLPMAGRLLNRFANTLSRRIPPNWIC